MKRASYAFLAGVVAVTLLFGSISVRAEEKGAKDAPEAKSAPKAALVNEGEFAKWLVQVLGLSRLLSPAPSEQECFSVLLHNSITPRNGWNATQVVTRATLARTLVQSLERTNEIDDPEKDESWIDFLKKEGVQFGTIGEAVENMGPLSDPKATEAIMISGDPLRKEEKFRPLDEAQQGTDMMTISRIFEQVIEAPTPTPVPSPTPRPTPRPRPVTPN